MQISADDIRNQIPYYLTEDQKTGLVKALGDFPNCNYYISEYKDEILQGDGWSAIEIVRFKDGSRDFVKGIMLSNSCDIDPHNQRATPPLITFAPLIPLSRFSGLLSKLGYKEQQIEAKLKAIRQQTATSIFYLPQGGTLNEEHIALLDDLHTIPLPHYIESKDREKLFTLSQVGFYIFIMKLSIHFCRMHENISR